MKAEEYFPVLLSRCSVPRIADEVMVMFSYCITAKLGCMKELERE